MDEISTIANLSVNTLAVNEHGSTTVIDEDEIFYREICPELDQLQKNPQPQTIEVILNYSKNLH